MRWGRAGGDGWPLSLCDGRLFADDSLLDKLEDLLLVEVANGEFLIAVEEDAAARYALDVRHVDNVGAVDAEKTLGRQQENHVFEAHEGHVRGAVLQVEFEVFALGLNINDVGQQDADIVVAILDEEDVVVRRGWGCGRGGCLQVRSLSEFVLLLDLGSRTLELGLAEGFEQVVNSADLVTINGILTIGCGEDNDGLLAQGFFADRPTGAASNSGG